MNDFPTSGPPPSELKFPEPQPSEPQLDPVNQGDALNQTGPFDQTKAPDPGDPLNQADRATPIPIGEASSDATPLAPPAAAGPTFNTRHFLTPFIAVAAWIVPGLGHLLVGRWGRALLIFLSVAGLALTGFYARGQVFPPHSEDPFGTLGFLADACSGVFFVIAHLIEKAGPDVSRAAGDYGTRFVAAAGLVNVLAVLDACGIALGLRN